MAEAAKANDKGQPKAGDEQPGVALADPTGTVSNRADGSGTDAGPRAEDYHVNARIPTPSLQVAPNGQACIGDVTDGQDRPPLAEVLADAEDAHRASVEAAVDVTQDRHEALRRFDEHAASGS